MKDIVNLKIKFREPFRPFDPNSEYRAHVDGRPRLDGIRAFLVSRGIHLPMSWLKAQARISPSSCSEMRTLTPAFTRCISL